eukprot:TRINITY_DN3531_c0_g2_i2.p1 TRINITY_DN3531_c0_g2~~TRINITY_DN3531_c0_g2_i2.p1  ORF type:complete len:442 (-),score=108.15 TRINITY_DN3531_c0_g2_i2:305-1630(-)
MEPARGKSSYEHKWGGRNPEGTCIKEALRPVLPHNQRVLVGVRGNWYDLTSFVPHHPGGDVLLDFAGRDATAQFIAYHPDSVLAKRKPVGSYSWDADAPDGDPMEGDYFKMAARLRKEGYFEPDMRWTANCIARAVGFFACMLYCVLWLRQQHSWPVFVIGAVSLAGFWQQSGFLMHDCMHNHHFQNRKLDQACGWFFASVCFGVSGRWWRDEHNEHHLFTNTVLTGVGKSDPQMGETVWCQDRRLFPYFNQHVLRVLLKVQHLIFIPVLIFIGPITIKLDSVLSENRPWEFCGIALHFLWTALLVRSFPVTSQGLLFWYLASCCVGVLEIQLLISHYSKPFEEKDTVKDISFARRQIASVVDVECPVWMDWFHGGLNLHSPHHLFPRMNRAHYRAVYPQIQQLCSKHQVKMDVKSWSGCIAATVAHLKKMDTLFSMDPRG